MWRFTRKLIALPFCAVGLLAALLVCVCLLIIDLLFPGERVFYWAIHKALGFDETPAEIKVSDLEKKEVGHVSSTVV